MNRAVLVIPLILLAACAGPAPSSPRVAAQSECPESLPDVDRLACVVSARPEPVPKSKPAPVLLRGPDGTPIIGPKSSQ
jgi:hypothetical protein